MSSTNRGAVRRESDFYETPEWVTRAILPHLPPAERALDPCAGSGAILRVLADDGFKCSGFELNETNARNATGYGHDVTHDNALARFWDLPPLVVMNPPFSLAFEFVERAVRETTSCHGTVFALLRLGFLASKKRHAFLKSNPCDVFVLSKRPSFTGGGTDSADYGWLAWGPGRGGRWMLLDLPEAA